MGFHKVATIAVKTGSYESEGKTKNRYEYIGRVMQDENGGKMYFLNRTFNPAGITPRNPEDDAILLSIFEDKPKDQSGPEGFPGVSGGGTGGDRPAF